MLSHASQPLRYSEKIAAIRSRLADKKIDGLIIRGTDRFLSEYVPENESHRVWLSGFTGSTGDIFLTLNKAFLFVDGRYYLQADQQVDPKLYEVVKVPLGMSLEKAIMQKLYTLYSAGRHRIGYSPDQFSVDSLKRFHKETEKLSLEWIPLLPSPLEEVRTPEKERTGKIWKIDFSLSGFHTEQKLARLREFMSANHIHLWIVQALDEIAYLSNLRGDEIPFQATFKSIALVTPDRCYIALPKAKRAESLDVKEITFIEMNRWEDILMASTKNGLIGFDSATTTEATRLILTSKSIPYTTISSPIVPMKANKTPEEFQHMLRSFQRADQVVYQAKNWLCKKVSTGEPVTEALFSAKVEKLFKRSGAFSLSFHIISAAGSNAAVIHYSNPDPNRVIQNGEMVLLDTGAYYEGGYATDLTRTFLVGPAKQKATFEQKRIFTLVLKGAIAGMRAVFPKGTSGVALDALVRKPMWEAGYHYNHGTGHGVGINVHESPPRVSTQGDILEKGQIFSIEPGIYIPEFGGVRIENLCTVIEHPKFHDWLMVTPLTFSPFDERLIDAPLLTRDEKKWLTWYKSQYKLELTSPPVPIP